MKKRTIGIIILALIFIILIVGTCVVLGWKTGLSIWVIGFIVSAILLFAISLIESDS